MKLQEYYKRKLFEYGFNTAFAGREKDLKAWSEKMKAEINSIYFQNDIDYYICADYFDSYVGDEKNWTKNDMDFLDTLGFSTGDFVERYEMVEYRLGVADV